MTAGMSVFWKCHRGSKGIWEKVEKKSFFGKIGFFGEIVKNFSSKFNAGLPMKMEK